MLLILVGMSLSLSLSLSPMHYTQVCVCVCANEEPSPLECFPNRLAPTNLLGQLHLGRHKIILYYIQEGTIDPTYNGGYTSWLYDEQIQ